MTDTTPPIRTAVFPVAGMGTRFLPATKANPKEMLPVVDKPLIQYAAEEAVQAGIETLVFVTGRNKRSIPDHFDKAYELEHELEDRGKHELLEQVRNIVPPSVTCVYVRQADALGLGHAVACARPGCGQGAVRGNPGGRPDRIQQRRGDQADGRSVRPARLQRARRGGGPA